MACTLLGVLYVPFLLNFFVRLCFTWREGGLSDPVGLTGGLLGIYLVSVVKFTDIGAFFTGRRFGKHKMFPRISPAKTWEGLAGGVVAAVLVSMGFFLATGGAFGTIEFRLHDALIFSKRDMRHATVPNIPFAVGWHDDEKLTPTLGWFDAEGEVAVGYEIRLNPDGYEDGSMVAVRKADYEEVVNNVQFLEVVSTNKNKSIVSVDEKSFELDLF